MSEISFTCPGCQENIKAPSESAGLPVSCPACHMLAIVPLDPNAPPPAAKARLSVTPTSMHVQPGAAAAAAATFYAAKPVRKKKSKVGLIVGLVVTACAIAAGIHFYPTLKAKYFSQGGAQPSAAADQTPTNEPPPPPPELTTDEVLQKVGDTYKDLTDYAAKAQTIADIDISAVAPGKPKLRMDTSSSLQLGRTNNYRLEWEQKSAGTTVKGAAWSSGKGNFIGYGSTAPGKVKSRQKALEPAVKSLVLSGTVVADLFFSDTNSLASASQYFTKTNGPSPNGQECYVLAGEENHQDLVIWVDKNTFLIAQAELVLGGKISDVELKKIPPAQRSALVAMSKLKGTVTETYSSVQINKNLLASAFESSYQPTVAPGGPPAAARPRRTASSPGQLVNPRRGQPAPQ